VSNSETNYHYLASRGIANQQKLHYIPNGLELSRFIDPSNGKSRLQFWPNGKKRLVVGTVGSLTPIKSPDVFVRTAARVVQRHPDVGFVHVGDGPLRDEMISLTRQLNVEDSVLFLGQHEDVPLLLASMDVFTLTSNSEGLPNAVMEAMAAGLTCVATDAGGCKELVRDGETGFVVPVGNEQGLADRILRLLQDEDLREEMGERGRMYMQEFDVHRMAERYRRLYSQVVDGVVA
jgi:glycosyltransferase involved in cell wall biosynthesis